MDKLPATRATNVIKLVHNWQNDGHQQFLHSEGETPNLCPCCDKPEDHLHFLWCKSKEMNLNFRHRYDDFLVQQQRLKTCLPLLRSFKRIFGAIRHSYDIITKPTYCNDSLGHLLSQAWDEQERIGWIQLFKGRLSRLWGVAQQNFYSQNPSTSGKHHFNKNTWMDKTITGLLDFSLGMWSDRCDILHGTINRDDKTKTRQKLTAQIHKCFNCKEDLDPAHHYIFQLNIDELCRRQSLQYLRSWIHNFNTALTFAKKQSQNDTSLSELFGALQI